MRKYALMAIPEQYEQSDTYSDSTTVAGQASNGNDTGTWTVRRIAGTIGGLGSEDYYSFLWGGGHLAPPPA
jgi:hypothetical protein